MIGLACLSATLPSATCMLSPQDLTVSATLLCHCCELQSLAARKGLPGGEVSFLSTPNLGNTCLQAVMLAHHIVPDAVDLLKYAQADGQYAAAVLLFNMASYNQQARGTIAACQAVKPLVRLLCHDSWYVMCPSLFTIRPYCSSGADSMPSMSEDDCQGCIMLSGVRTLFLTQAYA